MEVRDLIDFLLSTGFFFIGFGALVLSIESALKVRKERKNLKWVNWKTIKFRIFWLTSAWFVWALPH